MKKEVLILTVVAWAASASVTVSQQQPAPLKPAAASTTSPSSLSSPPPEKAKTQKTDSGRMEKFAGTIESVDGAEKILFVKGRKDLLSFIVDDKTKIIRGGKDMPFSDLKKEMGVAVDYKVDRDRRIAVSIRVAAPKAVPREKVPETPTEPPRK